MHKLGTLIYNHKYKVLLTGLIFIIIAVAYGTSLFGQLKSGGFQDKASESYTALETLRSSIPGSRADVIVLFSSKEGLKATDPAFERAATAALVKVKNDPQVENITTYYNTRSPRLLSNDQYKTFAIINLRGNETEQNKAFGAIQSQLTSPTLDVQLGGQTATIADLSSTVEDDLKVAEAISFSVLGVLLVVVFRGLVAAAMPLVIGGFAILGAFLVTRLLTNVMDISQFAINVIIFLGLGLAIDYSLFIVNRFREELRNGSDVQNAIATTVSTAGRTVIFSGLVVMISLLSLMVFPLGFLQSMGVGGAASVGVAVLGAIFILPAILSMLGHRIYALSFGSARSERHLVVSGQTAEAPSGWWYRLCLQVMRRPVLVIVLTLIPLLAAGIPFLHAQLQNPDHRSLPSNSQARIVAETLASSFPGKPNPIQVVITSKSDLTSLDALTKLNDFQSKISKLSGATEAASILTTLPGQAPSGYAQLLGQNSPASAALRSTYFSSDSKTSYINVSYNGEALDSDAQATVRAIRDLPAPEGFSVSVGGATAQLVDQLEALKQSIPYAFLIIVGAIFVLMFLMLGSFVVPIKSIILNILSLAASFGAIVWVFQDGHLANVLNFEPIGAIDANQPILIFAIAFGLSMDYAVFLLSRIKEEYNYGQNTDAAVASGVQKTGGIITSAALLLIVVVAAFGTSQIPLMKQLAVGLSLAIAIDAVVIRMLLVPASMKLLGRYNWWAPRPFKMLHEALGLEEAEPSSRRPTEPPVVSL